MITSKLGLYMCSKCNKLYDIYVQCMGHGDLIQEDMLFLKDYSTTPVVSIFANLNVWK